MTVAVTGSNTAEASGCGSIQEKMQASEVSSVVQRCESNLSLHEESSQTMESLWSD